jgi:hypothetical protein
MWNPSRHTDDENLRWCWLRAIEWDAWPFFVSQPIVPLLLVNGYSWWKTVLGLMVIQAVWSAFTYTAKFVNVWLAGFGVWIAMLRWVACPVAAYELFAHHKIGLAIFSLLWPLLMHILKAPLWMAMGIAFGLSRIDEFGVVGFFQTLFMQKLGYAKRDDRERDRDPPLSG